MGDTFSMFELTEIMRQKDDVMFAALLNRAREGKQTDQGLTALKSRTISYEDSKYQAVKTNFTSFRVTMLLILITDRCMMVVQQKG